MLLRPRWRVPAVGIAWLLAATVGGAVLPQAAQAAPKPQPSEKVASAPDLVSAQLSAKAQGAPVEVESMRTAESTTWVNPDGTLTTEQHAGPIRFRGGDGAWRDVDLAVADMMNGTAGAKSHPLGLSLAGKTAAAGKGARGASGTDLVAIDEAPGKDTTARGVVLGWPGALPAPVLKGERATYVDARPGVDVVVESRRSGFEQLTVIKDRAALEGFTAADGSLSVSLPMRTKGLTARVEDDGSVGFVDGKDQVVSRFVAPRAWDAVIDERTNDHTNTVPVTVALTQKGKGQAVMSLSVDADWVSDPARVFPITVDPTYATGSNVTTSFDTYVQKDKTWDTSAETELRVGTSDGGSSIVARSFLNFSNTSITGKDIKSASLSINETWSYSCTAKTVTAYKSGSASTSTRWTSQPTLYTSSSGSLSVAKGYSSSCPGGRISIPITAIVDSWSASSSSTAALRLSASETDSYGWKKFASRETSTDPYITYTYNRKPNAGSKPTVTPGYSYTPPGGSAAVYTSTLKPSLSATATDPDGNKVLFKIEVHSSTSGSALVTSCTSALVASGATGSCTLGSNLTNNTTYYARTSVQDDQGLWNGTWSAWTTFRVGTTKPTAPQISCPAPYFDGDTVATVPSSPISCTVTAAGTSWSAPSAVKVTLDGGPPTTKAITPSSDPNVAKTTVTVPNTQGTHDLSVVAVSPAQVSSTAGTYAFTLGGPSMTSPAAGTSSTGTVPVRAKVGGQAAAKLQYRLAGSSTGVWTDDPAVITLTPITNSIYKQVQGSWDLAAITGTNISDRVPVTFEARLCYYSLDPSDCTSATAPTRVVRLPSAFGAGYPVDGSSGVGSVAQFTGELATSATDVSVGPLSVGRSYASFTGDQTTTDPVRGVFGPGWTGGFGTVSGRAAMVVSDTTYADGTISFSNPGAGGAMVFARTTANRDYPTAAETYTAVNAAATESETTLTFTRSGTAATLTLTDSDGTTTTWSGTLPASSPTAPVVWSPTSVTDPSDTATAHTYLYPDSGNAGRVARIVDVPVGRTSADCPNSATWAASPTPRGCTALDITYGGSGATAPDAPGQVKTISARVWNPTTTTVDTVPVAAYTYDSSQRLVTATDSRTTLVTRYAWDGASTRLSTVTPPGQAPYRIYYDTAGRVKLVTRDSATAAPSTWLPTTQTAPPAGSSALARYYYALSPNGNGTALPDLSATATTQWNQSTDQSPAAGFAVIGPDQPWDGTTTVTAPASTSTTWQYAALSYTTTDGYTVNTGVYGAGQWLVDATAYDPEGRDVWSLSPAAIRDILATPEVEDPAAIDAMATKTTYSEDGLLTDVFEPVRDTYLGFGELQSMRRHTQYTYDQGAPNNGVDPVTDAPYGLVTTVTTAIAYPNEENHFASQITKYGYAPLESGDTSGWELGAPTTTVQVDFLNNDAGNITRATRYDPDGRVIETRQPKATSTADAGTIITDYYSGTGTTGTACQGRPEWDGMVCRERPGAPANGSIAPSLITKTYTYGTWGAATVTETSAATGTVLRTTTGTSDTAGRPGTVAVTSTVAGSTARPGQTFAYAPTTGLPTSVTTTGTSTKTSTGYDGWGRPTTYTNSLGETTTTTYGTNGMVSTVADPTGTQTFTWSGTDANGALERRLVPTGLSITRGGTGGNLAYTAAYDALGNLTLQTMPGALRLRNTYDQVGQLTEQTYTGQVTPVTEGQDPNGNTTWTPGTPLQDQPWLTWSRRYDNDGRVNIEWNGAGAAFDGVPGVSDPADIAAPSVGRALAGDKLYGYDFAGRLTYVADRTATSTGTTLEPYTDWGADAPCVVRQYDFDPNGNRTKLTEKNNTDGDCWGNPTPTTRTYDYDAGDRPLHGVNNTAAYQYDALGRQTTIPTTDAPIQNVGDITIGYYDGDLVRTMSQGTTGTTYTLDPESRRLDETVAASTGTTTTRRHYGDNSDNPAWITTTQGGATPSTTRYLSSLSESVSATVASDGAGATVLTDPHGDAVTSVALGSSIPGNTAAQMISGWQSFDEYGRTETVASAGALGYGYLAAAERSTTSASMGLSLMGVRLYNASRGLFTSTDPVRGGNETAYGYPDDPTNRADPSGKVSWWLKAALWAAREGFRWASRAGCAAAGFAWLICNAVAGAAGGVFFGEVQYFIEHGGRFIWDAWTVAKFAFYGALSSIGLASVGRWASTIGRALRSVAYSLGSFLRRRGLAVVAGALVWAVTAAGNLFSDYSRRR